MEGGGGHTEGRRGTLLRVRETRAVCCKTRFSYCCVGGRWKSSKLHTVFYNICWGATYYRFCIDWASLDVAILPMESNYKMEKQFLSAIAFFAFALHLMMYHIVHVHCTILSSGGGGKSFESREIPGYPPPHETLVPSACITCYLPVKSLPDPLTCVDPHMKSCRCELTTHASCNSLPSPYQLRMLQSSVRLFCSAVPVNPYLWQRTQNIETTI